MERREIQLYSASVRGDIKSLKELLTEDKFVLENYGSCTEICYNETPLHIAASRGYVDFAKVLLQHKPNLVNEPDSRHRCPLHLASANGQREMVKLLVSVDSDACLMHDELGRTPLHLAMVKSHVQVVNELVRARPEAIIYPLNQMKSIAILHSYVLRNGPKALEELVGADHRVLNSQDEEGNTILHKVVFLKQLETLEYLVNRSEMVVNLKNQNSCTTLDIINQMQEDSNTSKMHELLANVGTLDANTSHSAKKEDDHDMNSMQAITESGRDTTPSSQGNITRDALKSWVEKKTNALLICATVIASMAYQAGINPPGGVWEEDIHSYPFHDGRNITVKAGTSIMAVNSPTKYIFFWAFNTASFIASLSLVLVLTSGPPRFGKIWFRVIMQKVQMWLLTFIIWVTTTTMALTYLFAMMGTSPWIFDKDYETPSESSGRIARRTLSAWSGLISVVLVVQICWLLSFIGIKLLKCIKRSRRSANVGDQQGLSNANNSTCASV